MKVNEFISKIPPNLPLQREACRCAPIVIFCKLKLLLNLYLFALLLSIFGVRCKHLLWRHTFGILCRQASPSMACAIKQSKTAPS